MALHCPGYTAWRDILIQYPVYMLLLLETNLENMSKITIVDFLSIKPL